MSYKDLISMLEEYYEENTKACEHDCYNCELGISFGCHSGYSCAIETVLEGLRIQLGGKTPWE